MATYKTAEVAAMILSLIHILLYLWFEYRASIWLWPVSVIMPAIYIVVYYHGGYDWAIQSVFGRLTYNYDQRYLFETTMRYDGSSRFPTDSKYGFFPSLAAGWRIITISV